MTEPLNIPEIIAADPARIAAFDADIKAHWDRRERAEPDGDYRPPETTAPRLPRFAPDAKLLVDAHNGPELWTGADWNAYVERAERNCSMVTVRLIEIEDDMSPLEPSGHKVQLVVTYYDHTIMYYPVHDCWRISNPDRCIVIGKMPRTYVPLDQVRSFEVEVEHLHRESS